MHLSVIEVIKLNDNEKSTTTCDLFRHAQRMCFR